MKNVCKSEKINKTAEKETTSSCKRDLEKDLFLILVSPPHFEKGMIPCKVRTRKSTIFLDATRQLEGGFFAGSDSFIRISSFLLKHSHIFLRRSVIFTILDVSHRERTNYTSFILLINTNIVGTRLVHILKRM